MPGNAINRETARDALATLISSNLTGAGQPVQAVYNYQKGDFGSESPVVVVTSGPTEREKRSLGGSAWHTWVTLYIHVFVAYAIEGTTWGEDDAEDRLDLIEKDLADLIMDNRNTTDWDALDYVSATQPGVVEIGGDEYRYELISVRARVINDA